MAIPVFFTSTNLDEIRVSLSSWKSFTMLITGRKVRRRRRESGSVEPKAIAGRNSDKPEPVVCPICLEEIGMEDMAMKCPENNHFFHHKCLSEWLVHQLNPIEGISIAQRREKPEGTCPICRDSLVESASKLKSYLEDPNYMKDDRALLDKFKFRLRLYLMFFFADRKTVFRTLTGLLVFLFGGFKGFTLKSWTFVQDVVYFTLPNRLRLVTTVGYLFGLVLRVLYFIYEKIRVKQLH